MKETFPKRRSLQKKYIEKWDYMMTKGREKRGTWMLNGQLSMIH